MILNISLIDTSTWSVWVKFCQTGAAYSSAERQRVILDVRSVEGWAPHLECTSFLKRLFLVTSLFIVSLHCSLNNNVRSSFTPRYFGEEECSKNCFCHITYFQFSLGFPVIKVKGTF